MTYDNLLSFIELMKWSVREFEKQTQLANGTMQAGKEKKELSAQNIDKIVDKYSTELKNSGFEIVDLSPFGKKERAILTKEQLANIATIFNNDIPQTEVEKLRAENEGLKEEIINDLKQDKAFFQRLVMTGIGRLIDDQTTLIAYQKAWVDQYAEDFAKGDKALERQIKAKMSRLVGEHELGPVNKDTP